jgi:hypothetical protein
MRDIRTFVKLVDLNVPEYEHFDYYIEQYSKLERYKSIYDLIKLYEDFESKVDDPYRYKLQKGDEIIEFLQSTRAYNELNDDNLIPDLPVTKNFEYEEGKKYISVDLNKANWLVLKKYDPTFLNELGESYQNFLKKFNIHPFFYESKQFSQFIFGHLNPKRQIKAQRVVIEDLINNILSRDGLKIFCIRHDEVIFQFDDWSDISHITKIDSDILKSKIFTVERCENFRINHFYDKLGNFTHKELVGCNGNKYFMFLKKYIFNEPYDIRDLYFRVDGDLAMWNVEGLKIKL